MVQSGLKMKNLLLLLSKNIQAEVLIKKLNVINEIFDIHISQKNFWRFFVRYEYQLFHL